jgi:hypothetical protein
VKARFSISRTARIFVSECSATANSITPPTHFGLPHAETVRSRRKRRQIYARLALNSIVDELRGSSGRRQSSTILRAANVNFVSAILEA